jgi:hypothetical protein
MTTAAMTDCDVTVVISARTTGFLFEQRRNWRAFMQVRCDHLEHATTAGRGWLGF